MKITSITKELFYNKHNPVINILMETETSKEIRIVFKKGQTMKEHRAPFPIVVHVFKGAIDFGVYGYKERIEAGGLISLDREIPHSLNALEDSIVRLSLSKQDELKRVKTIQTT